MDLTIDTKSIFTEPNGSYTRVTLNDVDLDELLYKIPIEQVVKHYGSDELKAHLEE